MKQLRKTYLASRKRPPEGRAWAWRRAPFGRPGNTSAARTGRRPDGTRAWTSGRFFTAGLLRVRTSRCFPCAGPPRSILRKPLARLQAGIGGPARKARSSPAKRGVSLRLVRSAFPVLSAGARGAQCGAPPSRLEGALHSVYGKRAVPRRSAEANGACSR